MMNWPASPPDHPRENAAFRDVHACNLIALDSTASQQYYNCSGDSQNDVKEHGRFSGVVRQSNSKHHW